MKNATLANIVLSLTIDGVDYEFENITVLDRNDPLVKSLQASPQGKTNGLVVTTGLTSGVALSYTVYEVPTKLVTRMDKAFINEERIGVKVFDKKSKESQRAENAIFKQSPRNGTIQEGADSNQCLLNLEVTRNNIKDEELS